MHIYFWLAINGSSYKTISLSEAILLKCDGIFFAKVNGNLIVNSIIFFSFWEYAIWKKINKIQSVSFAIYY